MLARPLGNLCKLVLKEQARRSYPQYCTMYANSLELKTVIKKLNKLAPTTLASSWDNVGLLVEPSPPHNVSSMLLTNDLTESVMKEAIEKKVDMILSYHPPIFAPFQRLTQKTWKERIIIKCIENRIAVYSPHTSYDAVLGGVNDWLIKPFSGIAKSIEKVYCAQHPTAGGYKMELTVPSKLLHTAEKILASIPTIPGVTVQAHLKIGDPLEAATRLFLNCTEEGLGRAMDFVNQYDEVRDTVEVMQLMKPPIPHQGSGRIVRLDSPMSLQSAIDAIKSHLGLAHVRLAKALEASLDSQILIVAVCAGSGGSILKNVSADLFITGEMSHHDVLDANHRGTSVILCDHTNTERGFLKYHEDTLETIFEKKVAVHIAEADHEPMEVI